MRDYCKVRWTSDGHATCDRPATSDRGGARATSDISELAGILRTSARETVTGGVRRFWTKRDASATLFFARSPQY